VDIFYGVNNGIFDGLKDEFMGTIIKIIRKAKLLIFIDPKGDLYLKMMGKKYFLCLSLEAEYHRRRRRFVCDKNDHILN